MAKKSESAIGYDPLAWMNEGDSKANEKSQPSSSQRQTKRRSAKRGNTLNKEALISSFKVLAPQGEELTRRFYASLFERFPQVKPLFKGTSIKEQEKKLLAALKIVVESLNKPAVLKKTLTELGQRHQSYGALPEHYGAVAETLLDVMQDMAGELWTQDVAEAWQQALNTVAQIMIEAYGEHEDKAMSTSKKSIEENISSLSDNLMDNVEVLKNILDHAPVNVMIADADENVVYVNQRAVDVLTEIESELAGYVPGFRVGEVMGGSIHRYHKDPSAIKQILHGMRPGEVRHGEIKPGEFVFEHETRVLTNAVGEVIGYIVQWHDVTERRKREEDAFRLQRAIDGAQTAMMMIDRDLVITYINESTKKLLKENEEALAEIYKGFSADDVIGRCIDMFHKNPMHQRRLLGDPSNLPFETDIQVGPLMFHIRVGAMYDLDGNYIGNTLEWSDVTEVRKSELEVARLKSAVDGAQTNLMLCDNNLDITYVNPAVVGMLSKRAGELKQVFPGFDPYNLVGQSIDQFHKNPHHQRALLKDVARLPAKAEIKVADLEFEVNATAVLDPDGEYMGNMVEWRDITEQKNAERQIESLIKAAAEGDLEKRLDSEHFEGFIRGLADSVNELLDAVVRPIRESTRVVKSVSEGDLREEMVGEFEGEFAVMRDSVNQTVTNLRRMVGQIKSATTNIASASSEIAQGNADLSQRTEEQASSLEETASSMEELTSTVRQNADNARKANQLAGGAADQAEKGGEVVRRAVEAMGEINNSSKKIADIIGVIDEIAFQTNLLALNAAVEAARAGEQGRGFAVVAGEVRNLAQRSAGAAKEIKTLIQDSVEKVEDGTKLVDQSGSTLDEIVRAVKNVSDIIAEIASASQEQSTGIEQVNKAVTQMDEVTQQNAALVEEAAAASESMDEQARALDEMMVFFKLDESMEEAALVRAPVAPRQEVRRPVAASRPVRSAPTAPASDDEWEEF